MRRLKEQCEFFAFYKILYLHSIIIRPADGNFFFEIPHSAEGRIFSINHPALSSNENISNLIKNGR